jgi:hypothetical protein
MYLYFEHYFWKYDTSVSVYYLLFHTGKTNFFSNLCTCLEMWIWESFHFEDKTFRFTVSSIDIYLNDNFEPTTPFLSDQKSLNFFG